MFFGDKKNVGKPRGQHLWYDTQSHIGKSIRKPKTDFCSWNIRVHETKQRFGHPSKLFPFPASSVNISISLWFSCGTFWFVLCVSYSGRLLEINKMRKSSHVIWKLNYYYDPFIILLRCPKKMQIKLERKILTEPLSAERVQESRETNKPSKYTHAKVISFHRKWFSWRKWRSLLEWDVRNWKMGKRIKQRQQNEQHRDINASCRQGIDRNLLF